ncbi:MAG: FAD-dependent monooxygenase [Actinocatenispora sp.]
MGNTTVLIVGAGPTGLMLAGELRLAGVDVLVLERRAGRTIESRAGGMHARTLEVLDQRGAVAPFLAEGRQLQTGHFSALPLDFSGYETRFPYLLMLMQADAERLLEERLNRLGGEVVRDSTVVDLRQRDDHVEVLVQGQAGERWLRGDYLVGCDGGRSAVRKLVGIDFPGTPATMTSILGDVELTDPPDRRIFQQREEHGTFSVLDFGPDWYRVMAGEYDPVVGPAEQVDVEDLRAALIRIAGTDFGMHSPRWVSRFGDAARQADRYRQGRVLLAGDAAHIHYPAGGQGLNTGVQDAVNLGWKLAAVTRGQAPADLLDTYHAERHPVAERVLHNTRAQTALGAPGPHTDALRDLVGDLIGIDEVNRALGGMVTALDIRYPLGDGHPLLGRRLPDLDLEAPGATRAYQLLHTGRPVLLDLVDTPWLKDCVDGWADRVDLVRADCPAARWALPVVGEVDAVPALLVRPDGHVAWVATDGARDDDGLRAALTTWCGPAAG